jgi:hypothetical protein
MPNLLFFAPCEKVIIDAGNSSSLITILEEVKIQLIAGTPVPTGTTVPMQWAVLSLWEQSSAWDQGRAFEQRTTLVSPTGKHLVETILSFTFDKPRFRVVSQIIGMPISEPGPHRVKAWIRDKSDPPKEWREAASFPILIELLPPPQVSPPSDMN